MANNKKGPSKDGQSTIPSNSEQAARDNRSRQLNPNNDAYWSSRGQERPKGD